MADISLNLNIVIHNINATVAVDAFLAVQAMPQIPNPNWVDPDDGSGESAPMVDKFSSTKEYVEDWLSTLASAKLLKRINTGIDIGNRKTTQKHLTKL